MPKGGIRPRSSDGSLDHLLKPKWKQGKTRTIRVPKVLADQLLDIAHHLDDGGAIDLTHDKRAEETGNAVELTQDKKTEESSRTIDLTHDIKAELEQLRSNQAKAITLLQNAITPRAKGGSYAANNATEIKRLVELAGALLIRE